MAVRTKAGAPETSPAECVSYRLRRAARVAARFFDAALAPVGLRNTQFTLIATLAIEGEKRIGALADMLETDATTLNRNLEVLRRRGLIEDAAADDARIRIVRITRAGEAAYAKALPLWRAAQARITGQLGGRAWQDMITALERIEAASAGSP